MFLVGTAFTKANGQSVEEIKRTPLLYLWGEGVGTTIKGADEEALADLIGQISIMVSSSFETEIVENTHKQGKKNKFVFQESVHGIISTYSQSALTNTQRIVMDNEPNARVLRFIRKDDLEKVFHDRKLKVYDYVGRAEQHEKNARLSDALRYYNWALALLRSHPEAPSVLFKSEPFSTNMTTISFTIELL
jgi:hypothetical protein